MSALKQYLDLYAEHRGTVSAGAPEAPNALRDTACDTLVNCGSLPTNGTPGYEKTSLEDMYRPDFGLNLNRTRPTLPDARKLFRCSVPLATPTTAYVVNDMMMRIDSDQLPDGVVFTSFSAADNNLLSRYYGTVASLDNPGVALNTLLVQDGTLLYLPRGSRLERPIQIVNLHSSTVTNLSLRRLLIVAEPDTQATIMICNHSLNQSVACASNEVIELVAAAGSHISLCDMEESSATTTRHLMLYARQQSASKLSVNSITLSAGSTRNEYHIDLTEPSAELLMTGMAIARNNEHIDNLTRVVHSAPRCTSNQAFKYILDDNATGAFEGEINVRPGAVKTSAYQSNRNLLASVGARMHTQPQLLIYCDDVKCSHGATTGQLDADALFYMRQRGIPLDTARNMLMQAFMSDIIDTVPLEAMRERLRHMVERHLHGETAYCADCNLNTTDQQ